MVASADQWLVDFSPFDPAAGRYCRVNGAPPARYLRPSTLPGLAGLITVTLQHGQDEPELASVRPGGLVDGLEVVGRPRDVR
jgi:hypothetical protein